MLYKIINNRDSNKSYVTDSVAAYNDAVVDNAYTVEKIDTELTVTQYDYLKDLHNKFTNFHPEMISASSFLHRFVNHNPSDTEKDAEIIQIVDESLQCFETLQQILCNILGKKD